jgi:CBS-domain-containing membrane protein
VLDEESHVIGVVSESDLLNKMALGGGEDHMPGMITGILRHKQLEKARGVKRLPVVDAGGRLAGIVSRADVLAVYGRPDAEIAEDIRTGVLSTEGAANPGAFDVAVTEGVATLTGRPQTCQRLKTIRLPPGSMS